MELVYALLIAIAVILGAGFWMLNRRLDGIYLALINLDPEWQSCRDVDRVWFNSLSAADLREQADYIRESSRAKEILKNRPKDSSNTGTTSG